MTAEEGGGVGSGEEPGKLWKVERGGVGEVVQAVGDMGKAKEGEGGEVVHYVENEFCNGWS